jgi:DNA-binding HxlR family transcriptional regulator
MVMVVFIKKHFHYPVVSAPIGLQKSDSSMAKPTSTNQRNHQHLLSACPMTHCFSLLGSRWRPIILWKLIEGLNTQAALHRAIPLVSRKMLYQDLAVLIERGLVEKQPATARAHIPHYTPTALGLSLQTVLASALAWGTAHKSKGLSLVFH